MGLLSALVFSFCFDLVFASWLVLFIYECFGGLLMLQWF